MDSNFLRKKFLDFFATRPHKHAIVPSSFLIPDDPSVLLTTAGMQQFKKYYTGEADPLSTIHPSIGKPLGSKNAASVQKSFRTSDIDEVGDESHLTFFEMLGNFSFGGYFKEEAIKLAHELLISNFQFPISKMFVTVFSGDDKIPRDEESVKIWGQLGFSENAGNLRFAGREDNFWGPTGKEGPCGPTTEIYINGVEIWNIVFNEYYCDPTSKLSPLTSKGVDTGMGLERLAMISQGKKNIFETDLFQGPFQYFLMIGEEGRIIADHLRGSIFLIADGVRPSNKGAGYILRRLIRRVVVLCKIKGIPLDSLDARVRRAVEFYGFYHELEKNMEIIIEEIYGEVDRFNKTLEKGLYEFFKKYPEVKDQTLERGKGFTPHLSKQVNIDDAFHFHQTFGLTIDIIKDLAKRGAHFVDEEAFNKALKKHQEISRAGQERKFGGHGLLLDTGELKAANEEELKVVTRLHTATHLLQSALRKVLGPEVHQQGSDITVERTRFDFTFPRKLTSEELAKIEGLVNEAVQKDLTMEYKEMPYEEAVKTGALYFVREKYPPRVKVYTAYDSKTGEVFSKELCGGPHVSHTGEVGHFKIVKEESSSAGVRRIRAVVE